MKKLQALKEPSNVVFIWLGRFLLENRKLKEDRNYENML